MTDKPKKLTIKQKKFVKAYVANDGNGTKAALETYGTVDERAASAIASENLTKVNIRESIDAALEKHGITVDAAIKPIADGLTATRSTGGEDSYEMIDHSTRLKASGMALKLMGAEKTDAPTGTSIFVNGDATFNPGKYKK